MIVGVVTADGREATVDVIVQGPANRERVIRAVIDTGFNGSLALPVALVDELALVRRNSERAVLADGREVVLGLHEASVFWDGQARRILVLATGSAPLVGMALLRGYELSIQVVDGGAVRIAALPPA